MGLLAFNWTAILAATVAGMLIGALWYSPLLFGKTWRAALGKSGREAGGPVPAFIGAGISCLLSAIGLALILSIIGVQFFQSAGGGAFIGGFLGLTMVATAMLSDNLFAGAGWRLFLVQAGYRITCLIAMGAILGGWE